MANITLGGKPCKTVGELPAVGSAAPAFTLTKNDMSELSLSEWKGKKVILNIFPSVDTGICAMSSRKFNAEASALNNTVVACISRDLPFAQKRFCAAEGLENVIMLAEYKNNDFGTAYGVLIADGGFMGLHARAVVALDEQGKVTYTQLIPEVGQEPNYEAALAAVK
jgi:thiol peroxidase